MITRGKEIHGDKYDYSRIKADDIRGAKCKVPISCLTCGHSWLQVIDKHINRSAGCKICSRREPWSLNRFLIAAHSIHGDKYNYNNVTEEQIKSCTSRILIYCRKCQKSWSPTITHHINNKSKCPNCAISRGYSRGQIEWLEEIMENEDIDIQYALSPEKEYYIQGVGRVDGYCAENNTVYEYHGSFWHGNPEKYDPNDVNPISGKPYGELYNKTIRRDQMIKDMGYDLVVRWN